MANSTFTIIVPPAAPTENRSATISSFYNKLALVANSTIAYGNTKQTPSSGLYLGQQYFNTDLQEKGTWNGSGFAYPANNASIVASEALAEANAALTQADLATTIATEAYGQANAAYNAANSAAPDIYANGVLVLANTPNINFNNTSTANASVLANGTVGVNVTISVNTSAFNASPGGSNTDVLFNDSGSANGSANLVYNKATSTLTLSGNVVINGVNVPNGADIINIQAANNSWGIDIVGGSATGQSYGMIVTAGTNGSDVTMQIRSPVGGNYLLIYGNGSVQMVTTAGLLVGNTTFKGTAANTPVLSVNTSVTTGSAAANITSNTQASANKPGRPNTIVGWLPIYHDGIEGYIPIWGS